MRSAGAAASPPIESSPVGATVHVLGGTMRTAVVAGVALNTVHRATGVGRPGNSSRIGNAPKKSLA